MNRFGRIFHLLNEKSTGWGRKYLYYIKIEIRAGQKLQNCAIKDCQDFNMSFFCQAYTFRNGKF